jgi:hypothetical protein
MYTNIFIGIFIAVIALFLVLWTGTFFKQETGFLLLHKFMKWSPIIFFALIILLLLALSLDGLLFKNVQMHTYF